MHIAALELMPLLWILGIALSGALFFFGDRSALFCTLPAALAALLLCFLHHPPRIQVLAFFAAGAALWLLRAVLRCFFRPRKNRKFEKTLDSRNPSCYNDSVN